MAVQAHHQFNSNALALGAIDAFRKDGQVYDLGGGQRRVLAGAVISDPKSDLTCNADAAAGERKRVREFVDVAGGVAMASRVFHCNTPSKMPKLMTTAVANSRMVGSAGTSTSGRPAAHVAEFGDYIRDHNARLRLGLDQIQEKHYAQLLRVFEAEAANKIAQKEAEAEKLRAKQSELESRLKQVSAESQVWFNVAKNSEALVCNLRARIEQALHYAGGGDCGAPGGQAEDAESCCDEGDGSGDREAKREICRVCGERGVSVVLLPCRHLCICAECEPGADTCPICYSAKTFGLQVFLQ